MRIIAEKMREECVSNKEKPNIFIWKIIFGT
jgi:hypothetical protein